MEQEDKTSECVRAWAWGPFAYGAMLALDEGWSHKGVLHKFNIVSLKVKETKFGFGVVIGKMMHCFYFGGKLGG